MAKKLTINAVAIGNLRHRRKRYFALVSAVVLAMIFSCGIPFFLSCSKSSQQEFLHRQMGRQNLMILSAQPEGIQAIEENGILDEPPGYLHILSYSWTADQEKGTPTGWLDEQAEQLYYPQVSEGRMPEKAGEIAIERNSLLRMGLEQVKIGQTVTLHEFPANESEYLSKQTDKTYTLVGILDNRKSNIEQSEGDTRYKAAKIPSAFVSDQEVIEPGGKENLIALLKTQEWTPDSHALIDSIAPTDQRIETYERNPISNSPSLAVAASTQLVVGLNLMLAFLSCFGIANAFASNLKERKKQIGMLRAVGATRRQIIQIFGREAILIALICAPISVAAAYFGVKLYASVMGDSFVFLPSLSVLLSSAGFGLAVVILSALIPLLAISRISPMQAIRDTELMRKMKHKNVKSQHQFRMERLLAKRKIMFHRGRQIAVSLILAFTTVVCFVAVGESISWTKNFRDLQANADYEVYLNGGFWNDNAFISTPNLNDTISETQLQEAMLIPHVRRITGQKTAGVNLMIDGEYPPYLLLNEYNAWGEYSRSLGLGSLSQAQIAQLNRENLHDTIQTIPNPAYEQTRQWAGYTQELFRAELTARSGDWITQMESNIIEGAINLNKLDSGEEVILYAPGKIGFYLHRMPSGGFSQGLMDLSEERMKLMHPVEKQGMQYLLAEADSPFKVGDTLTLSMLTQGEGGQPIRLDRQVRIGAIMSNSANPNPNPESMFRIYTTVAGLDQFGQEFGYDGLNIDLSQEVTPELDRQMQSALEAIFPGKHVRSLFVQNERQLMSFKADMSMSCTLILVLSTVSISLVNNSISAQIREGKRTIGTLRAVGASQQDIVRSFVRQILHMTVFGTILGTASYCTVSLILFRKYGQTLGEFLLWPAPILFVVIFGICYFNLVIQVKKVSRHSIVENIREL